MNIYKKGVCGHITVYDLSDFKGRAFVTSDIHGCFDLLHEKMREFAFDTSKDLLFVAGDHCDRGEDSKYILDYIFEDWYVPIAGNHCKMFMAAYDEGWNGWSSRMLLQNGGDWAFDLPDSTKDMIYKAFSALPLAVEVITPKQEKVGIIHAQVPYNDWDEFAKMTTDELEMDGESTILWARTNYNYKTGNDIKGVDKLYVGHTPTESGCVEIIGNTHYIDLGGFFRGKLSFEQII